MRSHACLRRLAKRLAAAGSHVLRFDYYGTGDSAGELFATTVGGFEADIGAAIHELREVARVGSVRLVGVRLGATFAARAVARSESVNRLTMWDPVVAGAAYVRTLEESHRKLTENRRAESRAEAGSQTELVGFPIAATMLETLRCLELPSRAEITRGRDIAVSIIAGKGNGDEVVRYAETEAIPLVEVDFRCDWMNHSDVVLHPHKIIDILSSER
jgi:pimeloyl-ACP methyl ester carboxylesterase